MSAVLKVVVVVVSHRETVRVETTPPPATPPQGTADDDRYRRLREAQGSIDKLKPLELPAKSAPATTRASEAQR
jgi:hypothetical protein